MHYNYLIYLVAGEEARAQPSWHKLSCCVHGSKPKAARHLLSYLPILIILSVPSCSEKNTVLYRSTFTLYEMSWMPWFRVSHRKEKKKTCNNILLSGMLHALLGILAAFSSVRTQALHPVFRSLGFLIMANANWCQGPITQCLRRWLN